MTIIIIDISGQCKTNKIGRDYRGKVNITQGGLQCQKWDSNVPHTPNFTPKSYPYDGLDRNYCRNPDGEPGGPWCYTTSKKKNGSIVTYHFVSQVFDRIVSFNISIYYTKIKAVKCVNKEVIMTTPGWKIMFSLFHLVLSIQKLTLLVPLISEKVSNRTWYDWIEYQP